MTAPVDPVHVLERIRELESELADSWRLLGSDDDHAEQLPLRVLEVTAAGKRHLVPVDPVREVVAMAWPEPLAEAPEWVPGTISFGTQPVPLVDLGMRLGGPPTPVSPRRLMVIADSPHWLGLVVDEVGRVLEIDPGSIASPGPEIPHAAFVLGIVQDDGGDTLHLLSIARLGRELQS